jgi:hypothetical protein
MHLINNKLGVNQINYPLIDTKGWSGTQAFSGEKHTRRIHIFSLTGRPTKITHATECDEVPMGKAKMSDGAPINHRAPKHMELRDP